MRGDSLALEIAMVGLHRFFRRRGAVGDGAEVADEGELILGGIDLPAEEGDAGAVLLGIGQEPEGVVGRPGAAAENADDE